MARSRASKTPSQRYAEGLHATEIGSTAGEEHDDIIRRTLGRDRALLLANGLQENDPVVTGNEKGP